MSGGTAITPQPPPHYLFLAANRRGRPQNGRQSSVACVIGGAHQQLERRNSAPCALLPSRARDCHRGAETQRSILVKLGLGRNAGASRERRYDQSPGRPNRIRPRELSQQLSIRLYNRISSPRGFHAHPVLSYGQKSTFLGACAASAASGTPPLRSGQAMRLASFGAGPPHEGRDERGRKRGRKSCGYGL